MFVLVFFIISRSKKLTFCVHIPRIVSLTQSQLRLPTGTTRARTVLGALVRTSGILAAGFAAARKEEESRRFVLSESHVSFRGHFADSVVIVRNAIASRM